ncbi:ATP-binding cassette sub-family G member 5 [Trichonephila inaurata madagascariensis]|uniref:ATP-binding cassette sub-family G member 5 n=1 Tax=Trichonephila inaurata madagascariensis TaxID=2747483 RepID=A0A8X7CRT9_9ARAC|nr:ATP-binding cassette sub-family G member 5 [Trichonephila inaurata madagascariensis]
MYSAQTPSIGPKLSIKCRIGRGCQTQQYKLAVGIDLVKDPVMILLDDPTYDLDPLNTYFVISILSNHAKKYNRIVILSMEKPRSDIFPFLDRVTYLSLGEVVYTGSTRMLLDYFGSIGFPCPELENPLMYYLCLSTVDRRTRERFIESSTQISALVEKFKIEGAQYRKYYLPATDTLENKETRYKLPLTAYGQPSSCQVFSNLVSRRFCILMNCSSRALREMFLRIFLLPLFFTLMFCFYFQLHNYQHSFLTRNGLMLNCMVAVSFLPLGRHHSHYICSSSDSHSSGYNNLHRFEDARRVGELGNILCCLVDYICIRRTTDHVFNDDYPVFLYLIHYQYIYTNYLYNICKWNCEELNLLNGSNKTPCVIYICGGFLKGKRFLDNPNLDHANYLNGTEDLACATNIPGNCVYVNGNHYLLQKYHSSSGRIEDSDLQYWLNFGLCFVFVGGMWILNTIIHLIPLPAFIKTKFRN